ncbi:MAG: transketolase, partial [Candidatus Sericytochromatia bacterium]|nr:transketolase [Candidatus Tanganyikabacteria bacterium]
HDSIGLGEDGPTHQPVEHLMSLRAMPGLTMIRPCDAAEAVAAWITAVGHTSGPVGIVLSRQKLPILDREKCGRAAGLAHGAYVLAEAGSGQPKLVLIATGSEVHLALAAREKLEAEGIPTRVVSMPSWELFEAQPLEYRQSVLPPAVKARVAIEAGVTLGWERYAGDAGEIVGLDRYGASAPGDLLLKNFGFNVDNVVARAKASLARV